jgi:cell division protein FtsB
MNNKTCPHCGAEQHAHWPNHYSCWTQINAPSIRDVDCYKRQLAAKDEEIDVLNTKLALLEGQINRLRDEAKIAYCKR